MFDKYIQYLPGDIQFKIYIYICTRLRYNYFMNIIPFECLHNELKQNAFKMIRRYNIDGENVLSFERKFRLNGMPRLDMINFLEFCKSTTYIINHDRNIMVRGNNKFVYYCRKCKSFDFIVSHRIKRIICRHCKMILV